MLRIVIADDEADVIELCKMLIDYSEAEVVGSASNGIELIERINELKPNVVITDINMPGMTGLESIEEIQKTHSEINFVVMSGYADFEYAQKTIKLGVWDYLLKPLQGKELNKILQKIDGHNDVNENLKQSQKALIESELKSIWLGEDNSKIGEYLNPEGRACVLYMAALSKFQAYHEDITQLMQSADSLIEDIENKIKSVTPDIFKVDLKSDRKVYLTVYPPSVSDEELRSLSEDVRTIVRKYNNQSQFVFAVGGASNLCGTDGREIGRACREAVFAIDEILENKTDAIIPFSAENRESLLALGVLKNSEEIYKAITNIDIEKAKKLIEEELLATPKKPVPGRAMLRIKEVLEAVNKGLLALPERFEALSVCEITIPMVIYGNIDIKDTTAHILENIENLLSEYNEYLENKENTFIVKAKKYVKEKYSSDISLEEIAGIVGLSASYFSTLFKKETGMGFIKYVQEVRIDEAKNMLKTTALSVEEIARRVGYYDVKHFNKVFRDVTKVKPTEYRRFYS